MSGISGFDYMPNSDDQPDINKIRNDILFGLEGARPADGFRLSLRHIINTYSVDSLTGMHDHVLAELIVDYICVLQKANIAETRLRND